MTVTALDRALVAGDAGRVTGERQERPDPEVPEKARRRAFTAEYKQEVLDQLGIFIMRWRTADPRPSQRIRPQWMKH